MLDGKVGILRTMPPGRRRVDRPLPSPDAALGHPWPEDQRYGDYLRDLDGSNPKHLAILHAAASLFRGAGYTPFDGAAADEHRCRRRSARPTRTSPRRCGAWSTASAW